MSTEGASCSSEISVNVSDAFQRIMLNKRFGSWIELDNALKDFHKMTHTHYVHAEMFRCTFGRKRKSGLNVNKKPSKFLNCQSMFRVRLEGQQYVIKSYNMSHNHPCTSSWMVCDPLSRRLSSEEKENLKPVILHCQSTDEVIESIKERTAHQLLRCCCRWKLDNTHNLQNNTGISLPRRSKEYIQLQRLQRMCKQQIVEKYGERFANQVERKVYNFYLRIINS
ncbi:unnamed protein product [Schistosoma intercalatum]|nr:unnamed protein product [Schistosoma intercalatum]